MERAWRDEGLLLSIPLVATIHRRRQGAVDDAGEFSGHAGSFSCADMSPGGVDV